MKTSLFIINIFVIDKYYQHTVRCADQGEFDFILCVIAETTRAIGGKPERDPVDGKIEVTYALSSEEQDCFYDRVRNDSVWKAMVARWQSEE